MMHYEGHIKLGRYPQSERMVELQAELIKFLPRINKAGEEDRLIKIFEPCCDKGLWAAAFKKKAQEQGFQAVTYGVELNKLSYEQAMENFDHCLCGGAEHTIVTRESMDILLLNPPYGYEPRSGNDYCTKSTKAFLSYAESSLAPDGWLFFVIPFKEVTGYFSILDVDYKNIAAFKFPEWEEMWSQVLIVAQKKNRKDYKDFESFEGARKKNIYSCRNDMEEWIKNTKLEVIPCGKPCKKFNLYSLTDVELAALAMEQGTPLLKKVEFRKKVKILSPAMELTPTSYANVIVSGEIKGVSRQNKQWNIVGGRNRKEVLEKTEEGEDTVIEKMIEVHRQEIKVLMVDGKIKNLLAE